MSAKSLIKRYSIQQLYHFTDKRNLPSIRKHGLLSWAELDARGISPVAPGGNDLSHELDKRLGLHTHVHLCFTNSHPMEFRAREDKRLNETLYLEIDPQVLSFDGVLFSADVSNKTGVEAFGIEDVDERLDLDVIYTWNDWRQPDVQARRKLAEKHEILVPDCVPVKYIRNLR